MGLQKILKWALISLSVIIIAMVFIVPYLITPFKQTVSLSYDYQFNNIISVLLLCAALAITGITCLVYYSNSSFVKIDLDSLFASKGAKLNIKHLYIIWGVFLVIILFFFELGAGYGYGEANYFLLRIDRINMGQIPYKDFEYAYGVLLLYLPVAFTKIFHLSTTAAYYLNYAFLNCVGLYFLYYIVNYFNISVNAKKMIFYAIAFSNIPICLGVNVILFRYLTPFICLLVVNNLYKIDFKSKINHVVLIAAVAFFLVILNFLISIEFGIALCLAILSYFYVSFLFKKNSLNLYTGIIYTALFGVTFLLLNANLLLILKVFASGGNNLPVTPAPSILFYVISFVCVNVVFVFFTFKKTDSFLPYCLLVLNIIALPGAFGRCDPMHLLCYGFSSFICFWAYLSYQKIKIYKLYSWLFVLVFTISANLSVLYSYRGMIGPTMAKFIVTHNLQNGVSTVLKVVHINAYKANNYLNKQKSVVNFVQIDQYSAIAIPFDTNEELYLHVLNAKKYVPEYYTGLFLNVYTTEQIKKKLAAMQGNDHNYMIISKQVLDYAPNNDPYGDNKILSALLLFPFKAKKKRFSQDFYNVVYGYIQKNYKVISILDKNYYLVGRISK